MKKWTIISIILLAFVLAVGCGDDSEDADTNSGDGGNGGGDGGGGELKLSVDEDTPADELTTEELEDVCSDIYAVVSAGMTDMEDEMADMACGLLAVGMAQMTAKSGGSDADVVDSCEENMTSCKNGDMDDLLNMQSGEEMTEEEFCDGADESVEDCDATAGEIANCMVAMFEAQYAAFEDYLDQIPECGELTVEFYDNAQQMAVMPDDVETPTECAVIAEKCPEMLEDME